MNETAFTIALVAKLAAVGVLLSSVEFLARPAILRDSGLMSWGVDRLRTPLLATGLLARTLDPLVRYPNIIAFLAGRALLAALVIALPFDTLPNVVLTSAIAVAMIAFSMRNTYGHDGADQMLTIIFVAISASALIATKIAYASTLWFIAAQSCLAYIVAGSAKAISPGWRAGSYLADVCGTRIYGDPALGAFFRRHSDLSRVVSRALITWECSFPLVLILPRPAAAGLLASGLFFHFVNAYVMGLNTFVWAFAATYPAIWYCVLHRGW